MAARVSEQGRSEDGGCRRCLGGGWGDQGDPGSLHDPSGPQFSCL